MKSLSNKQERKRIKRQLKRLDKKRKEKRRHNKKKSGNTNPSKLQKIPSFKDAVDNAVEIANFHLGEWKESVSKKKNKSFRGVYGSHSIDGCRGKDSNEDTEICIHDNISNLGEIEVYGVFDGHSGKLAATKMMQCSWIILKKNLCNQAKSFKDINGIEEAFRLSQIEWMSEMPLGGSGTTVVLSLIIKENWDTYNLCIGDARFYYINKNTGDNLMANIDCFDYEDQSRKSYYGPTYNKVHHIIGPIIDLCTGKEVPKKIYEISSYVRRNNIKKCLENYNKYSFPDKDYWEEWVKWNENKKCNPSEFIIFPYKDGKAWRMDTLQPSRSLGKKEKAIHMGVLYKIKISPENTVACYCCDGIDDNKATNETNFGKFVINFDEANKKFFEGHIGIQNLKKPENYIPLPKKESTFFEKVKWFSGSIKEKGPLDFIDNDYKYGINQAIKYFQSLEKEGNISLNDIYSNTAKARAIRTAFLCSLRLSADNVTITVVNFDLNQN